MECRVHFVQDNDDCTIEINAVNSEAAAKQVKKEFPGAVVKKVKVINRAAK